MESILITANFSNRTGYAWSAFYRVFNAIARHLRGKGVGTVLSFATIEEPVEVLDRDLPHSVFRFDPIGLSLRDVLVLRHNIKRGHIRYAYLTDMSSWHWVYALMRLWGVRVIVVHSHVSVADPNPPAPERGLKRLIKRLLHRTPMAADHVLACSQFVRTRLIRKACCPADRITVLSYGLPAGRFFEPSHDESPARVTVFCAARATCFKGIQHLVEATGQLVSRVDRSRFEVLYAGEGPDLDRFKARAAELGLGDNFKFLGQLRDTTDQLRTADVVVIPSDWGDAFPYSVLEALAAGRAVVATKAGGIPEQLGDPPVGMLVPPGDASALAQAIETLILDPELRARLGEAAYRRASSLYREGDYFDRVLGELDTLLLGGRN